MALTVFSTTFNDFGRDYMFVKPGPQPAPDEVHAAFEREKTAIFEQLMLFDQISFKLYGENVLVPLLIKIFGLRAFESLVEQQAIGFTLWTPTVMHFVSEVPGVDPLGSGMQSSPVHCDPEQSLQEGLSRMTNPLPRSARRSLSRKLLKLYTLPRQHLARDAVGFTMSAYESGKLAFLGLDAPGTLRPHLPLAQREALGKHAQRLLEYRYLLESGMTSLSSYDFFAFFRDTSEKIAAARTVSHNFAQLTTMEDIPDLQALMGQLKDPFENLPNIRARRNAVKFRQWIANASLTDGPSIKQSYMNALEEGLGLFETKSARCVKSLVVSSIGMALGNGVAGLAGAITGGAVAPILERAVSIGWDQVDEFVLNGVTQGWKPRMFFNDLRALRVIQAATE